MSLINKISGIRKKRKEDIIVRDTLERVRIRGEIIRQTRLKQPDLYYLHRLEKYNARLTQEINKQRGYHI